MQNAVQNPSRPFAVVNSYPENQHDFRRLKTAPGENSYSKVVKDHKGKENNIVIFSNSIADFNRNTKAKINNSIQSGRVRFRNFTGATLGEFLHYIDPTLAEGNYDTAIVHVDINDIENNSSTKVENLVLNLEKIVIKLKKYGIKNVYKSIWLSFHD